MGHVPDGSLVFETFDSRRDLENALQETDHFDSSHWLFVPPLYAEYRFILGERGERPIICVGINPSTAKPCEPDQTVDRVKSISEFNGYEGYFMLNTCAQRATRPDDVEQINLRQLHTENMEAFKYLFSQCPEVDVWAAWGGLIKKRKYFGNYLYDIFQIGKEHSVRWLCAGTTKDGHPRHPSRLKKGSRLRPFDFDEYLVQCFNY